MTIEFSQRDARSVAITKVRSIIVAQRRPNRNVILRRHVGVSPETSKDVVVQSTSVASSPSCLRRTSSVQMLPQKLEKPWKIECAAENTSKPSLSVTMHPSSREPRHYGEFWVVVAKWTPVG